MKPQDSTWLTRLGAWQPFFAIAAERESRPAWSLGGLAAGAVPWAVRQSHGYEPQFPSDGPEAPQEARSGDFFRN
jgi:hypothetical protein